MAALTSPDTRARQEIAIYLNCFIKMQSAANFQPRHMPSRDYTLN